MTNAIQAMYFNTSDKPSTNADGCLILIPIVINLPTYSDHFC